MEEQSGFGKNSNNKYLYVTIFLIVLIVGGIVFSFIGKNEKENTLLQTSVPSATIIPEETPEIVAASPSAIPTPTMSVNELQIEDQVVGTGVEAVAGKKVSVNYLGTLTDGTKFDSSYDRGTPFSFTLGAGEVISGWDQGVAGMKVGGKRKLTIPSSMGYGVSGIPGVIPGGATLVFEVELLNVE